MSDLEFSFEPAPWESWLRTKQVGDCVSATELLTVLEEESEQAVEDALQEMEMACLVLDVSDLPKMYPPVRQLSGCGRKCSWQKRD